MGLKIKKINRVKLNQSYTEKVINDKKGLESIKNFSKNFNHNNTEIHNNIDIIEIKTNDDVLNEMKLRNEIEDQEKRQKNKKLNISLNSKKSNYSRNLNDSETDSVLDMKNLGRSFKFDPNICTVESLNSTDFKKYSNLNDSCFYSQQDINEFKINVNNSKL